MSQKGQLKLENFFNVKSSTKAVAKSKLNLSISKKPMKSPKLSMDGLEVIDLISDDEVHGEVELNCSGTSNTSDTTLEYSIDNNTSPGPSKFLSPKKKFYSPTKKRSLSIKSPMKAKRNLNQSLGSEDIQDEKFTEITRGLDDNTIFLMRIVYACLSDRNLRCLMTESSINLLEKSITATPPAKRIVCRLYWQVEQWCKWKKIKDNASKNKTDIDDPTVQDALNYLIENGFITVAQYNETGQKHELDFDEIVKVLNWEEVKEICKRLNIKAKNKEVAIQLLKNFMCKKTNITNYFQCDRSSNEDRLLKILGEKAGPRYKLANAARETLNELHILMYLVMDYSIIRDRNLELMLINEKSKRETYPVGGAIVDNASVVFKNRLEFESYLKAHSMYEEFLTTTDLLKRRRFIEYVFGLFKTITKEEMMSYTTMPVWLRRFTPPHIHVKILEESIPDLKKDRSNAGLVNDVLSALIGQDVFRQHKKADWIVEKALILDRFLGEADQAAKVLIEGFRSNLPAEEEQLLYPRALRLATRKTKKIDDQLAIVIEAITKKCTIWEIDIKARHVYKVPIDNYGNSKIKFVGYIDGVRTVMDAEKYCIHDYVDIQSTYTHGEHWEGKIVTTLFFLLFWDIIYAPLRGVRGLFLSHYQAYPLDLFTDCFYANRKLMIENRLREIEECTEADMLARMQATWQDRPESDVTKGLHRDIGWDNVSAVGACLGPRRVAMLCRRLAMNYRYAHSGFPDLTLWNVHTKQIVFVEVKTDSDKPSMKQKQWMHYMKDHEINVEFCYIGVNTRRARSRNCGEYSDDDE